jgi:hypothetical protein
MIMKQAKPTLRNLPRRELGSSDLDPAKLSTMLRELASRAHELVRAVDASFPGTADSEQAELAKVYAHILSLQRNLGSHQQDDLGMYVSALRERVEEYLV